MLRLPPGPYATPRVAPDGKRIAFGTDDGKEAIIWTYDLSGASGMQRLTFGGNNRFPIWTCGQQRVAFQSDREGDLGIFWQPAVGGAVERLTKPEQGTSHVPESWSPKGDRFLFSVTKGPKCRCGRSRCQDRKATPFGDVHSSTPTDAVFSPDGRWVAYTSYGTEQGDDLHPAVPDHGNPLSAPLRGLRVRLAAVWSPDGKELFYNPGPGRLAWQRHDWTDVCIRES